MARIFISYSRTDEEFARRLATDLDPLGVDLWIDVDDIPAGMKWSTAIQQGLDTCDMMIVIISPDSMASRNVEDEWQAFLDDGKPIIPVLWRPARIHFQLRRVQHIDFHTQNYETAFAQLHAELGNRGVLLKPLEEAPSRPHTVTPDRNEKSLSVQLFDDAYVTYRNQRYSEALAMLRDCLVIDPGHMEAQKLLLVIEQRVKQIAQRSQDSAVSALLIRSRVYDVLPPPFDWIVIPAGQVSITTTEYAKKHGYVKATSIFEVSTFAIAKYPITNAQFAKFIDAECYLQSRWWTDEAWEWLQTEGFTESRYRQNFKWNGIEQPVVGVSWHEAVAFCQWLSNVSGEEIILPTEQQWQRAAQGDSIRQYPWGAVWDGARCNNSVGSFNSSQTSSVRQYEGSGDSVYGVVDMAGNVWEWCLTVFETGSTALDAPGRRCTRGGAWINNNEETFCVGTRDMERPFTRDRDRGFRIARRLHL